MCTYSMLLDYGRQQLWPQPFPFPFLPSPNPQPFDPQAEQVKIITFMELLEKAKETDTTLEQPDCEDPQKLPWLEELKKRLDAVCEMLAHPPGATEEELPLC